MTCYISNGTQYLAGLHPQKIRLTKNKEDALKFPDEQTAFPALLQLRGHLSKKELSKWKINVTDEEWIDEPLYYLVSKSGYLTTHNKITNDVSEAGSWSASKCNNVLRNQCNSHPNLKYFQWEIQPVSDKLTNFFTEDTDISDEIEQEAIRIEDYSQDSEIMQDLLPFFHPVTLNNSLDFVKAMSLFYTDINERKDSLLKECSKVQRQIVIVEHAVELTDDYDPDMEHKIVELLRVLRRKRRKCKDELMILQSFLSYISPHEIERIVKETKALEDRYYAAKDLHELFSNTESIILENTGVD